MVGADVSTAIFVITALARVAMRIGPSSAFYLVFWASLARGADGVNASAGVGIVRI